MSTEQKHAEHAELKTAMKVARIYYQNHLKDPAVSPYVKSRKLSPAAVYKFQIGFAPDEWRGLVDHFSSHKIRLAAKEASLVIKSSTSERLIDFFRGRLIFPIKDPSGEVVGYAGRLTEPKEGVPKYINTAETPLFRKGDLLYGMHENGASIRSSREAVLVEGYMDVITMSDKGFPNGLAPMGTALTKNQFAAILGAGVRRLTVCLDGDSAGIKAAERSIAVIMEQYHPLVEVMVATLPDNHDPDSCLNDLGPEAFQAALNNAVRLDAYIHQRCADGHRIQPGLDERAEYLHRLQPYIAAASGALHTKLFRTAADYTCLPEDDLANLLPPPPQVTGEPIWDSNTALAARWLVNDLTLQQAVAQKLASITLSTLGLNELAALAKQYRQGEKPTGVLHQYAKAHGPLLPSEIKELRQNWQTWMKRATVEEGLKGLAENPYSEGARQTIRLALR